MNSRRVLLACVLAACAVLTPSKVESQSAPGEPLICIVIRTYWGHGRYGEMSLKHLLGALKLQTHQRWEALLLVMDNRPFPDLRYIVRDTNDSRVSVFAEWISYKYPPKDDSTKQWSEGYHGKLYNLTDEAIRACPQDTEWVVVTNGDNDYDSNFFSEIIANGEPDTDVIAFDYYSRYQRPTAPPCDRFASAEGAPNCKENALSFCNTDLSANVYRFSRMVGEDMRFGLIDPTGASSALADGMMADIMVARGWRFKHVKNRCMVEHAPSPQMCALEGKYWDDTIAGSAEGSGGSCISATAGKVKADNNPYIELREVNVTHDGASFGILPGEALLLKCLRYKKPEFWTQMQYFGAACASPYDKWLAEQQVPGAS